MRNLAVTCGLLGLLHLASASAQPVRADRPDIGGMYGLSLGGQAVIYVITHRPHLFWGHIASNPALHRNLDLFLEEPPAAGSGVQEGAPPSTRLFVSCASNDDPRFGKPARRWIDHWTATEREWQIETRILEGRDHFSAAPEAFRQGIQWLFATTTAGGDKSPPLRRFALIGLLETREEQAPPLRLLKLIARWDAGGGKSPPHLLQLIAR